MESLNYGSNKYLSSHDDELHAKNWVKPYFFVFVFFLI